MNVETIEDIYRGRIVLLDMLEKEGYNTAPYRKFSPKEIAEMIKAGPTAGAPPALQMDLERKERKENEPNRCKVIYTIGKIKQKLTKFMSSYMDPDETDYNPLEDEIIVITLEPIAPNFHAMAYLLYRQFYDKEKGRGPRIRFFQTKELVVNRALHFLVPPHIRVPKEQEDALLKGLLATKKQLPVIRFHEDMQARLLGLLPGDIVHIIRPSPSAGEYDTYRVCAP